MFNPQSDSGYRQLADGIRQKTLNFGERTLMAEFKLAQGSLLPVHAHPYEQTGYLISGRLRLRIGGEEFAARAGDSWCIPADVEHGAQVLEDAVAIEVFSPVREDYLPADIRS
ncbi:MAG: cupin domain-containing protein [Candidatus Competibacteraceae bacterium]|nr:cupin domain-containing protein [Candidatus Competibacteraceae bacterium]